MRQREFEFKGETYVVTHNGPHISVQNKIKPEVQLPMFEVVLRVMVSATDEYEALELAQKQYVGDDILGAEIA